jgi:hypothetical protein
VSDRVAAHRQSNDRSREQAPSDRSENRPAGSKNGKKTPWYMREKVAGPSRSERIKKEIKEVQSVSRWKNSKSKKKHKTGRVITNSKA